MVEQAASIHYGRASCINSVQLIDKTIPRCRLTQKKTDESSWMSQQCTDVSKYKLYCRCFPVVSIRSIEVAIVVIEVVVTAIAVAKLEE